MAFLQPQVVVRGVRAGSSLLLHAPPRDLSHRMRASSVSDTATSSRLKILSYNTHLLQENMPFEKNELLRYIHNSEADVVCLQEYAVYKDAQYPT